MYVKILTSKKNYIRLKVCIITLSECDINILITYMPSVNCLPRVMWPLSSYWILWVVIFAPRSDISLLILIMRSWRKPPSWNLLNKFILKYLWWVLRFWSHFWDVRAHVLLWCQTEMWLAQLQCCFMRKNFNIRDNSLLLKVGQEQKLLFSLILSY